eukprot:gene13492-biopygen43
MPARALLYEVSVGPYWEVSPRQATRGSGTHLRRQSGHLSLLKLRPQLPLPPGALSQGDGGFIYKSLTGAAAFFSEMPCLQR